MAEHPQRAGNGDDNHLQHEELIRRELERQRFEERRVSRALGFADFMAALMVIATGFSAFAAWRTAEVTSLVFATADRPFVSVAQMQFEGTDTPQPYIAVGYRNFGRIPAVDGLITVEARINGKNAPDPNPSAMDASETGPIAPDMDHFVFRHLASDAYRDVAAGRVNLQVGVRVVYKGPASERNYCNFTRFVYDYRTSTFRPAGGSDSCKGEEIF
jgi:hypothetical protein